VFLDAVMKRKLGGRLAGRSGAIRTGCQNGNASCCIALLLDGQASIKKAVAGFDLIKEQTVVDRVLLVDRQLGQGVVVRKTVQTAGESGKAYGIQPGHVLPIVCESGATSKSSLRTENGNRCGLFPERSFGSHDLQHRFVERHAVQVHGGIAENGAMFEELTS
jgi:hypothetical protein